MKRCTECLGVGGMMTTRCNRGSGHDAPHGSILILPNFSATENPNLVEPGIDTMVLLEWDSVAAVLEA